MALLPSAALVAWWLPHDDAMAMVANRLKPKIIFFMDDVYYLFSFTEPWVVVSVGAPFSLPTFWESAAAAVCEVSFTVPS